MSSIYLDKEEFEIQLGVGWLNLTGSVYLDTRLIGIQLERGRFWLECWLMRRLSSVDALIGTFHRRFRRFQIR